MSFCLSERKNLSSQQHINDVMRDSKLTIEAKSLYAYFFSFVEAGEAFPSRDIILKEMGISKDRYYKHINLLLEYDYIRRE